MRVSLFTREVVPFFLRLALLGLAALAIDALLHWLNAVWIGRYLGIPGVLLISARSATPCANASSSRRANLQRSSGCMSAWLGRDLF